MLMLRWPYLIVLFLTIAFSFACLNIDFCECYFKYSTLMPSRILNFELVLSLLNSL